MCPDIGGATLPRMARSDLWGQFGAAILVGVLAVSTPAAAQIYKWTDKSGTIHFSDTPPSRGSSTSKVDVLPKTEYRPPAKSNVPPPDDPPPPPAPAAEAPRDEAPIDDSADYASEPYDEDAGSEPIVLEGSEGDPAVWRRANSPRNRPGQPIRQPMRRR